MFGDGSYSGNIIQGGSALQPDANGIITITGAATITPDANGTAFAMCMTLVLDGAGASLAPSVACKGLLVLASVKIEFKNGAGASMTAMGVAGQVLADPSVYDLIPTAFQKKFNAQKLKSYTLKRDGAAGTAVPSALNVPGLTGNAGASWQSGSGGSGAVANSGTAGAGALGTCFSGGSGGGANVNSYAGCTPGVDYGGAGGNSTYSNCHGGTGNPGGSAPGGAGNNGTGGLLLLLAPVVLIGAGSILQADGVSSADSAHTVSGASGGGIVGIVYKDTYTNSGTVRANGGASGTSGSGANFNGGPGGAGSVNIGQAA